MAVPHALGKNGQLHSDGKQLGPPLALLVVWYASGVTGKCFPAVAPAKYRLLAESTTISPGCVSASPWMIVKYPGERVVPDKSNFATNNSAPAGGAPAAGAYVCVTVPQALGGG